MCERTGLYNNASLSLWFIHLGSESETPLTDYRKAYCVAGRLFHGSSSSAAVKRQLLWSTQQFSRNVVKHSHYNCVDAVCRDMAIKLAVIFLLAHYRHFSVTLCSVFIATKYCLFHSEYLYKHFNTKSEEYNTLTLRLYYQTAAI